MAGHCYRRAADTTTHKRKRRPRHTGILQHRTYQSEGSYVAASPNVDDPAVVLLKSQKQSLLQERQRDTALPSCPVLRWSLDALIPARIELLLDSREFGEGVELLSLVHCSWVAVNEVDNRTGIHHQFPKASPGAG